MLRRKPHYALNRRTKANGLWLLKTTPDNYTPLVFFDPQYREVLDKLKYGNEGKRQKGRVELPQMDAALIGDMGAEIARILKPSGYVMFWADKFIVAQALAPDYFTTPLDEPPLQIVDLITWDKMRIGMGYRSRRRAEYLVVLQKPPIKAKGTWARSPCVPDCYPAKIADKTHPHQKPLGLINAIIAATTKPGDVIVDPCAGSFVVMDAALDLKRKFLGCDILGAKNAA